LPTVNGFREAVEAPAADIEALVDARPSEA
jgi:hypothetical protein